MSPGCDTGYKERNTGKPGITAWGHVFVFIIPKKWVWGNFDKIFLTFLVAVTFLHLEFVLYQVSTPKKFSRIFSCFGTFQVILSKKHTKGMIID